MAPRAKSMKVESWPVEKVKPYPLNPRRRSDEDVRKVADSIRAFGFQQPIVVDREGVVIVGHGRLRAAIELLELKEVPVVVAGHLSDAEAKAYRLADNRAAEGSTWDMELLPLQLGDLHRQGFDLQLTLFDDGELAKMLPMGRDAATPPGAFPEVDENLPTEHRCPKCGYEWSGKAKREG